MDFTVQIDVSGPRRGPNTGKVMHRDYPNFYKNLPGPEVEDVLTSGLTPIQEILSPYTGLFQRVVKEWLDVKSVMKQRFIIVVLELAEDVRSWNDIFSYKNDLF